MTERSEHVGFELLNDYVDGRLDSGAITLLEKHLRACVECGRELESLRSLLADTALLPRSVLPEDDLWADVRSSIDRRKNVMLPSSAEDAVARSRGPALHQRWWQNRGWLAVAAIVLVVLSSAVTAVVLRSNGASDVSANAHGSPGRDSDPGVPPVLPASFRIAEGQYTRTIEELVVAVEAQRAQLNPETVRTVDRSLAIVDSAIAEARAALLSDPNNRTLVDLLSASYQRKLDLLRRTSELSSRI